MPNRPLHIRKRTKIVATLGPASSDKDTLKGMIQAGMNTARLNFSHGDQAGHAASIALIRQLSDELRCPVAIMGDLRGPRIRVGEIEGGSINLEAGKRFTLTPEPCQGDACRVSISYPGLAQDVKEDDCLLLDDGTIEVRVKRILANNEIEVMVINSGILSSRRGINIPNVRLSLPPLTQKDLEDIDFAVRQDIDLLALSFVQSVSDIRTLKTILAAKNSDIGVVAKIEMSGGLDDIEAIVAEAEAVMVARGDMALEMSYQEVPIAQKRITVICRQQGVPVITATQMLESMVKSNKPTRAEVTDVANAVFDGTDAVMLSGETAIGHDPVRVIDTMTHIVARAEYAWRHGEVPDPPEITARPTVRDMISYSSWLASQKLQAAAIITYSRSGSTARQISRFRPDAPVIVLTPDKRTYNRLALTWGVNPILVKALDNTDAMTKLAISYAKELRLAKPGDSIIITSGNPAGPPGNTNLLRIERIEHA